MPWRTRRERELEVVKGSEVKAKYSGSYLRDPPAVHILCTHTYQDTVLYHHHNEYTDWYTGILVIAHMLISKYASIICTIQMLDRLKH